MYYTYIIYSETIDRYYIGYTSNLNARLTKHQMGGNRSTKLSKDWKFVYTEEFEMKSDALKREREIKKWKSRQMIEKIVSGYNTDHKSKKP